MNAPAAQALPRGVYAITDPELLPETRLAQRVAAAIAGGARTVQYRDKTADASTRLRRARALAQLCRDVGAVFIVNDHPELALEVGADGVHVGQHDEALAEARAVMGPRGLVGVSCYDRIDLAVRAAAGGADYVAFGSMFPSTTKPGAVAAPLSLVTRASGMLEIPVVAIGGPVHRFRPRIRRPGPARGLRARRRGDRIGDRRPTPGPQLQEARPT